MSRPSEQFTLWNAPGDPPADGLTYRWQGHAPTGAAHSLLAYAEANGERLRRKYLNWIEAVGQRSVRGRRLVEHLELEPGLSYWWLTGFVEKSPYAAPISDVIRVLAIEELIDRHAPSSVRLVGIDERVAEVLAAHCHALGIRFLNESPRPAPSRGPRRSAIRTLAGLLRASWPYRAGRRPMWAAAIGTTESVLVSGYFVNVDPSAAGQGQFLSRYWERLGRALGELRAVNWLHHNSGVSVGTALAWREAFERTSAGRERHVFVDQFVSAGALLQVVRRARALRRVHAAIDPAPLFRAAHSDLPLWPFAREEWTQSLVGPPAVARLLALELFDAALRAAPRQPLGLYLHEGNDWERAFIHAWRAHGHGRLVGVAHSTVRFWDLRCFNANPAARVVADTLRMPAPDVLAVNGPDALRALADPAVCEAPVVEVEAVRYLHLAESPPLGASAVAPAIGLLVIGDISATHTRRLLDLLADATIPPSAAREITLKPHPANPVATSEWPALPLACTAEPLSRLLGRHTIAFASGTTSGAVDAWLAGLEVIVALDPDSLNFSPLRGRPGVRFVSSAEALGQAIVEASEAVGPRPDLAARLRDYFALDSALPRWRRLLAPPATPSGASTPSTE